MAAHPTIKRADLLAALAKKHKEQHAKVLKMERKRAKDNLAYCRRRLKEAEAFLVRTQKKDWKPTSSLNAVIEEAIKTLELLKVEELPVNATTISKYIQLL